MKPASSAVRLAPSSLKAELHATVLTAFGNGIVGMLAKSLSFGLAGIGLGALTARDLFHDYRGDISPILAGSSFMLAFLLLSRWAPTGSTDGLLRATAASVALMISMAALISRIADVSQLHPLSLAQTALVFIGASLAGNLALLFPALRSSFTFGKASVVIAATAIASGIGFLEGVVLDPQFGPSIVQDAAAEVGALAGAILGILLASRVVRYPDAAVEWSWVVAGTLFAGSAAAEIVWLGAVLVTPLAAIGLRGPIGQLSKARSQMPNPPTAL